MERIGIIDLGSNTTRLVVMACTPRQSFKLVDEVRETVRLAEGVGEDGKLQPEPMRRAIEALKMFSSFCRATDVDHIIAVGTSAIREATNQHEFLDMLHAQTGLHLRILSGEEEAYYGYMGVVNSIAMNDGYVIDIGGGSTEVTEIYGRTFSRAVSRQSGIVRFSERYITSDPISKQDFRALKKAAAGIFADLDWLNANPGFVLVGIGGTIRNLARIDQKRRRHPLGRVHGYVITRKAIDTIVNLLRRSNHDERENIPGLNRDRADVILPGAVIVQQLMQKGNFTELVVGGSGLREGLFYEHFLEGQSPPLFDDVRAFSVQNLAHVCNYEAAHATRVRHLSLSLFDQTRPLHGYGAWERELLGYAATLHDIGVLIGYYDHHKHSAYLVLNATLNGFAHREIALLAVLVRAHRKGSIDTRDYRSILTDDDPERAARLGAILRIAEYLERSKSQVVQDVTVHINDERVTIQVQASGDAAVEIWDANRRAVLFQSAFACEVAIV